MTEYHSVNAKLWYSQQNKLKCATKIATAVTLRLSSDMKDIDKISFPHNLLPTDKQVESLHKTFANSSSKDTKLWKTWISKIIQSGGFSGRLLGSLMKVDLKLLKNVLRSLLRSVLIPDAVLMNRVTQTIENETKIKEADSLGCCYVHLGKFVGKYVMICNANSSID